MADHLSCRLFMSCPEGAGFDASLRIRVTTYHRDEPWRQAGCHIRGNVEEDSSPGGREGDYPWVDSWGGRPVPLDNW